ncbi:hypothetical protein LCGC14_2483340, partial [marine sediment metagenome]
DRPWKDVTAININCRWGYVQTIGSAIHRLIGNAAPDAAAVRVRVNGADLAQTGSSMYGSYVHVEAANSEFADHHFPGDGGGNLYKVMRLDNGTDDGDLRFEGTNPSTYANRYFKLTNEEENDYSDLINMLDVLNNTPDDTYYEEVSQVIDVEQWLRYLALDALFNNQESGLNLGVGDDYMMYRGIEDPRFVLVPHDMDSIFAGSLNHNIFTYNGLPGLNHLLNHPDITPLYYQAFLDLIETVFNPQTLNPLLDQVLGGYVPQAVLDQIKGFVVARTAGVLAQIPQEFTITPDLPIVDGYPYTVSSGTPLSGTVGPEAGSVLVDGVVADLAPRTGTWSVEEGTSGTLVAAGSSTTYHVPTAGEDPLAWTATDFDDSNWSGTRQLVITEVQITSPDFVEIQNLSPNDLVTDGWVLAVNYGTTGDINRVQPITWDLTGGIKGYETQYRTDSNNPEEADYYFGSEIYWGTGSSGWAMIVDNNGAPVDFLIWGYEENDLRDFKVTINGGL